jgi:nucleoside-diphosphate-sugar epimerase
VTKPLVLGATSFIGRAVIGRLGDCFALSRTSTPGLDLRNASEVTARLAEMRPTSVIHCIGITSGNDAKLHYETHVLGTLHLLQAVKDIVPQSRVVLLGTAAEYGPAPPPTPEEYPACPETFYGASKLAQTHLGQIANLQWGLHLSTLRLFNVIGPGLPAHYFLGALARRFSQDPRPSTQTIAHPQHTRDFVDVRDVADAIHHVVHSPDVPPGVYNVATGIETSLGEAAHFLAGLAGGKMAFAQGQGSYRVQVSRSAGDASRLRSLGWQPRYNWQQSLTDLWESINR